MLSPAFFFIVPAFSAARGFRAVEVVGWSAGGRARHLPRLARPIIPEAGYRALDRLINHEWKTQLDVRTDGRGVLRYRGFRGAYALRVETDGQPLEVHVDSADCSAEVRRVVVRGAGTARDRRDGALDAAPSAQPDPATK